MRGEFEAVKGGCREQHRVWRIEGRRVFNELAPARLIGILPLRTHLAVALLEAKARGRDCRYRGFGGTVEAEGAHEVQTLEANVRRCI